jgi:hypothetical protein
VLDVIVIDGQQVASQYIDYGVELNGEVLDFGDDLLGAALDAVTFGGRLRCRTGYVTQWRDAPQQPLSAGQDVPGDDQV